MERPELRGAARNEHGVRMRVSPQGRDGLSRRGRGVLDGEEVAALDSDKEEVGAVPVPAQQDYSPRRVPSCKTRIRSIIISIIKPFQWLVSSYT